MKNLFVLLLALVAVLALVSEIFAAEVKVKIDGEQSEAAKFVQQLNENGRDYDLRFILADTG